MTLSRRCFLLLTAVALACPAFSFAQPAVTNSSRVGIVGDSITEQKLYSKFMECYLLASNGTPDVKCFQYGWGGETAGGFAGRLENDIAGFNPTIVTLCYGMNDGGYQPYKDAIGQGYEGAMRNVLKKLEAFGVKTIVVGSPGAVDTKFFSTRPIFGTQNSAEGYNNTLAQLRDIDKKLAAEHKQLFADVHAAMHDAMVKAKKALGDDYDVCGKDGFHPGPNGQLAMAYAFLKGLGCEGNIGTITVDLKGKATATDGHKVLASAGGKVELESTRWPYCYDGDAKSSGGTRSITPFLPFNQDLNRYVLKVTGLEAAKATVKWGAEAKQFTREQLTAGINLTEEFSATPFDAEFAKLTAAVGNKQGYETTMIKSIITTFRSYPAEIKNDPEGQQALAVLTKKLHTHQAKLDADARKTLVPVKHELVITQ